MSDQADIFGHPVTDAEKARESFLAGGTGTFLGGDIGGAGLVWADTPGLPPDTVVTLHDCDFAYGHCQLGHGHVLPHCVPDPDGSGSYLMVDESGWILREI
jgi:hypothetical protein